MANPLLDWTQFPDFAAIKVEHISDAFDRIFAEGEQTIAALEQQRPQTWAELVDPMQHLSDRINSTEGIVRHLNGVCSTPEWRAAIKVLQPRLVAFRNRVQQSQPLYEALTSLRDTAELNPTQRRILDAMIRSAEQVGVQLPPQQRQRLNTLLETVGTLQLSFADNVLDSINAWSLLIEDIEQIDGVPQHWRVAAAERAQSAGHTAATADDGPWLLTLDYPSAGPILQHCTNRELRETLRRAWGQRAATQPNDNAPLISQILTIRAEIAQLLGDKDYPSHALRERMAGSVSEIEALMETLHTSAHDIAIKERDELDALAATTDHPTPLKPWDVSFWSERDREHRFALRDDELRPYFSLNTALPALFTLCEELFGVTIDVIEQPKWHRDVRVYQISEQGKPKAFVYLDPYARPENKQSGAWMYPLANRTTDRLPVAVIVCNLPPPTSQTPSLIGLGGARTLFHEFGHALHHMLTEVEEVAAAGIRNVEWDAVELPSLFMENWLYHRPVLTQIARHHSSGEPLDDAVIDRILDARKHRSASTVLTQVIYSLQDLAVHSTHPDTADPFDVARAVRDRIAVTPALNEDRWLCSFQHIFAGGYAAGYYSYLWAAVLSADAFSAFEEDIDNPEARRQWGRRFRRTVLARGGSQHPVDIFTAFRGRPPTPDALLRHKGLVN